VSTARPTDSTAEITETICARLAAGESLRTICADEAMPAQSTVYLWLTKHSEFSEQYARAREVQAETLVDEILEISDDGRNDYMLRQGEGEETLAYRLNGEHVQRSRPRNTVTRYCRNIVAPGVARSRRK
jgi:hypothetical protein